MSPVLMGLLAMLAISALATGLAIRKKPLETPVKVMLFIGYFWLWTFLQLIAFGLVYFVTHRFFDMKWT